MIGNGRKWTSLFVIYFFFSLLCFSQKIQDNEEVWIRSMMEDMTLDEKVGQLFIVRAYGTKNPSEEKTIAEYIKKYHIGGLCFFQGSPETQALMISRYQSLSDIPMFMSLDAEWGLGMRFPDKTISFPKQMMLGAIQDNTLIYEMGKEIARQCKETGININFAPVVDIHSNPDNPVIYDRSFGESPFHVTAKSYMYMKGMEDAGILSCVKHFPGHGDTHLDSHRDLPTISHHLDKMKLNEFFPFKQLIDEDLKALMVGHLHISAIDSQEVIPASLSQNMIKKILRNEWGFQGLVFTDAMDMEAITRRFPSGIAEAMAFMAGNDVILLPRHLPVAFQTIRSYIKEGKISEERLDESLYRILQMKYRMGLLQSPFKPDKQLMPQINHKYGQALKQTLAEAAVTVVRDKHHIIPFRKLNHKPVATLSYNVSKKSQFQHRIDSYLEASHYQLMPTTLRKDYAGLLETLSDYEDVILVIHTSGKRNDYTARIPRLFIQLMEELQIKTRLTVVLLGNPYLLNYLENIEHLIVNYDNDRVTQDATAQGLMGVFDMNGRLPFSIGTHWSQGHGLERKHLNRLGYALPESVGVDSGVLKGIDSVMQVALKNKVFPGGQVLVAKERRIIYQKSFGTIIPKGEPVQDKTIYDLASLTKILSTTLTAMHLFEKGAIHLDDPLKKHIFNIDTTNKADITLGRLLAHHGRLQPWAPFYTSTLPVDKNEKVNSEYYRETLQAGFSNPVAKNMFLRDDYRDSVYAAIYKTPLRSSDSYKYSDLGYYLLHKAFQNKIDVNIEKFVFRQFYEPLGLRYTGYNPVYRHDIHQIAPSEKDDFFRHQIIRGHVQDKGAAMLGGVAGHSGLFSTSAEVTILMQMLLNGGTYGGIRFFNPETVAQFTTRYPVSTRRGYGFDLKELDKTKKPNMSALASPFTFGHLGYTGTATWADPNHQLIYTFCSNRTYPSASNTALMDQRVREKIQTIIYLAIFRYSQPKIP